MNLISFLALLSPAVLLPHTLSAGQIDQQHHQLSAATQTKPTRMTDLAEWTRSHLEPLFIAHEDTHFAEAYAAVFSSDVSVRTASAGEKEGDSESSNGVEELVPGKGARVEEANGADAKATLEKYLKGAATTANARVEWGDVAVRDGPDGKTIEGMCTIVRSMKFRIRAAPATTRTDVHFSAVISDESSPKISHYTQTISTHRVPVVMPHLPVQPRRVAEL